MTHYIEKSALVAEIEKIRAEEMAIFEEQCRGGYEPSASTAVVWMKMEHLLSFIDTLEVKEEIEVDLEKEIENWIENNQDTAGFYNNVEFARHFFELGLKAREE